MFAFSAVAARTSTAVAAVMFFAYVALYLDFINMFLFLLRIFGGSEKRRR